MLVRNAFAFTWLVVEISLAFYAGMGYTVLVGYSFVVMVLTIPLNIKWVNSELVKTFLGKLYTPDFELMLRGLKRSRSYKVTVVITSAVLLGIAMFMLIKCNVRLIELI
jgi:hypothetical protein